MLPRINIPRNTVGKKVITYEIIIDFLLNEKSFYKFKIIFYFKKISKQGNGKNQG